MAWREISYIYSNTHMFQKHLLWLDKNANIYFAMRAKEADDWAYFAGDASHGLAAGSKLTQYNTEGNAQANYLTTTRDPATGKFIALLPANVEARYIKLFVQSGSSVTIREWWPSAYITAHEIVSGEILITDDLSDAPRLRIEVSNQERVYLGNLGSGEYGLRCRDSAGNIIFETSNAGGGQNLAGWKFDEAHLYKLASGTPLSSPNDGVVLRAVNPALLVYEDTAKRLEVGYLAAGIYGIKGYDTGGSNVIFELSDTQQVLGGWKFDQTTLKSTGDAIILDAASQTITVGSIAADGIQIASAGIRVYDGGTQKGAWDVDSAWWLGPSSNNRRVEWEPDTDTFYVRGNAAFDTLVFQEILTTKGSLIVAKSGGELFEPCTATGTTFTVRVTKPVSGGAPFASGDRCRIDNGLNSTWFSVGAGSDQTYYYQYTATYQSGSNSATYKAGTGIIDYGQSGQGYHLLTADEANSPRYSIYTHAGSPWSTVTELMRFGNLNGFLGYASAIYGIAIGDADDYLKYDPTNGMQIAGNLSVDSMYRMPSDEYLIGHWMLDDGTGTITVDSAGNSNASLEGAVTKPLWMPSQALAGNALEFQGPAISSDDYLKIPDVAAIRSNTFSVAFAIKPDAYTVSDRYLLHKKTAAGKYAWRLYLRTDRKIQLNIYYESTLQDYIISTNPITVDTVTWARIGFTYNYTSKALKLYIDGALEGSTTTTDAGGSADSDICFSYPWGVTSSGYDGTLDDLRLYNCELTQHEMKALTLYPAMAAGGIISANLIRTGTIQSSNYNGSSAGMMLDLNNADFRIYEANGLNIYSGGGIKIRGGGNLSLVGDDTTPGAIVFDGSTYDSRLGTKLNGAIAGWVPATNNTCQLHLGYDAVGGGWFDKRWNKIYVVANDALELESVTDLRLHARPTSSFGQADWKQAAVLLNWNGSVSNAIIGAGYSSTQYIYLQFNASISALSALIEATDPNQVLTLSNFDRIRLTNSKTPASAGAAGSAGEICWDASYIYVCIAANTWKKAAISTW